VSSGKSEVKRLQQLRTLLQVCGSHKVRLQCARRAVRPKACRLQCGKEIGACLAPHNAVSEPDELIARRSARVSALTEPQAWLQFRLAVFYTPYSRPMSSVPSIPEQFRRQAGWREGLRSPLYTHLLSCCADVYETRGSVLDLLQPLENDNETSALPLRFVVKRCTAQNGLRHI